MGVEQLLRGETSGRRVWIVSTIAVGAIASLVAIAARDGAFGKLGAEYWIRDWSVLAALTLAAIALVTMYVRGRARPATRVRVVLVLLALLTIENAYNDFHPKPAAWDMFEHPLPFLRLIRIEAPMGRILGLGIPAPNVNSAFRVFGLNSLMTFTPPRVYELYRHYGASPTDVFMSMPKAIPPDRVLDHAHVPVPVRPSPRARRHQADRIARLWQAAGRRVRRAVRTADWNHASTSRATIASSPRPLRSRRSPPPRRARLSWRRTCRLLARPTQPAIRRSASNGTGSTR